MFKGMLLSLALGLTLFAGCAGPEENRLPEGEPSVTVEEFAYARTREGDRRLSGVLLNNGADSIRNAQVQVSLYDEDNQRVSTMQIEVTNIAPGGRKPFTQMLDSDEDIRGAKVQSVMLL